MRRRNGTGDRLRWLHSVWLTVVVVLTAACNGASDDLVTAEVPSAGVVGSEARSPAIPPPPSPTPSPVPPAVTPEEYQAALTALDEDLSAGLDDLRKRRAPVGLPEAVARAREQVESGRGALAAVVPPETVAGAHAELDTALADLSLDLGVLESDAAARVVCAGDSVIRRLGDSEGAAAVREASARLAESDPVEEYTVGTFAPAEDRQRNRRGRNGDLRRGRRGGVGELEITGAPDVDSLLKLRTGKRGIRNVYVRRNATVTVEDLPDGTYEIYLAQGRDWSKRDNRFTRDCTFSVFDDKLTFETTATQYTVYQLELLETVFGNATSTAVDPDEFPN